jgi:hypothetical protein
MAFLIVHFHMPVLSLPWHFRSKKQSALRQFYALTMSNDNSAQLTAIRQFSGVAILFVPFSTAMSDFPPQVTQSDPIYCQFVGSAAVSFCYVSKIKYIKWQPYCVCDKTLSFQSEDVKLYTYIYT